MTNPFTSKKGVVDVSIFDPRYLNEDTRPADWRGGFNLTWVAGCGFGLLGVTFHADDRITIDTECMGRRFASSVFRYILNSAEYDVPAEEDEPLDGWQPLTAETELPKEKQIEFWEPRAPGGYVYIGFWFGDGCDLLGESQMFRMSDLVKSFTHYRVVRGPEGS